MGLHSHGNRYMRILVTGGSSFVGAHFALLAARRHEVIAVHHRTPLRLNGVTPLRCDLRRETDRERIAAAKPDAIVHLAAKIRTAGANEETPGALAAALNHGMMDAVLAAGCPVVYGSSTVVHWAQETPYGNSRKADEARLKSAGLPYAIVRPCAPYGPALATHQPGHRESFQTLVSTIRYAPFVPVLGDGQYRRQPVHIHDLGEGILALLDRGLCGQTVDVGGAEALSFDALIDTIAAALGKHARKLHIPKSVGVKLASVLPNMEPSLLGAVDTDELADPAAFTAATGVVPRGFSVGVRDLL